MPDDRHSANLILNPWGSNIVVAFEAPLFKLVLEDKHIELVDQNVLIVGKSQIELLSEHQLVVADNTAEVGLVERPVLQSRIVASKFAQIQALRMYHYHWVSRKDLIGLVERDSVLIRQMRFINRDNNCHKAGFFCHNYSHLLFFTSFLIRCFISSM